MLWNTEIKERGIAIDIDDTLAATNRYLLTLLEERFGNPDNVSHEEIIKRYRYTQHVPFWKTPEALAWMEQSRNSGDVHDDIPLIAESNEVVRELQKIVSISAYVTARPESVRNPTIAWLTKHGFPEAPLIMKPQDIAAEFSNKWKAGLLHELYPTVWGIIDDNPKLLKYFPENYKGTLFLYDHEPIESSLVNVVPVQTWKDVLPAVQAAIGPA